MNRALFDTWKTKGFYLFNKITPPRLQSKSPKLNLHKGAALMKTFTTEVPQKCPL